jgi:hypothetical protein
MKPSELYVGVIDFFANLVPGAVALYPLSKPGTLPLPAAWPPIQYGSPEGWAVFLVAAYLTGHVISAAGGFLMDKPIYDCLYRRWRRTEDAAMRHLVGKGILSKVPPGPQTQSSLRYLATQRIMLLFTRLKLFVSEPMIPPDNLLEVVMALKARQLADIGGPPRPIESMHTLFLTWSTARSPDSTTSSESSTHQSHSVVVSATTPPVQGPDVASAFDWALSVVRLKSGAAAAEVDSYLAQSKMFRSLTVVALSTFFVGWGFPWATTARVGLLLLCLWRFLRLRWDATERVYEYFLALGTLPPSPSSPS